MRPTPALVVLALTLGPCRSQDLGFRAEFNGAARRIGGLDGFLPPSAAFRFDLRLTRRATDWKVTAADWRPVEPIAYLSAGTNFRAAEFMQ